MYGPPDSGRRADAGDPDTAYVRPRAQNEGEGQHFRFCGQERDSARRKGRHACHYEPSDDGSNKRDQREHVRAPYM